MGDIVDRRYRVEQKLAVGGFGAIYRATDLSIGRPGALKVLHRELAGDPSVVARFRREAAALARLKSPNTLTLYDVGETDDTLYFVMELLRGESLEQVFLREGRLPWRRVARIIRGVCNSLREAHAIGLVHRDLKPANIFLETHAHESDFVKVLDFGIAKVLETSELPNLDLTRHGHTVGTFDYMAPEQMIGGRCSFKSDVFTLGVVMYEMIAGTRPYGEATSPPQMVMALLSTTPAPLHDVPAELGALISRCLAREVGPRPTVAKIDEVLERMLASSDSGRIQPGRARTLPHASERAFGAGGRHAPTQLSRAETVPLAEDSLETAATILAYDSGDDVATAFAAGTSESDRFTVSSPPPVPKGRFASGTTPPERVTVSRSDAALAVGDSAGVMFLRAATVALCLFSLGFLIALAVMTL